jgi:hypothetical protein
MAVQAVFCLNCKRPITKGRSDKKFCDSVCKDEYYNARKQKERSEITKIDGILKRNRRILEQLYDGKKPEKKIGREIMLKKGFEFGFYTHKVITKGKGSEIIFCYDFGYREESAAMFRLFPHYNRVQVKDGQIFEV